MIKLIISFCISRDNNLGNVSLGEVIEAIKELAGEGSIIYTEGTQTVLIR